MFRDAEIIDLIKCLSQQVAYLNARPDGEILQKIADLQDMCQDIKSMFEIQNEKLEFSLRDDEELKLQVKIAMREFKEEMEKPIKKVVKKK